MNLKSRARTKDIFCMNYCYHMHNRRRVGQDHVFVIMALGYSFYVK